MRTVEVRVTMPVKDADSATRIASTIERRVPRHAFSVERFGADVAVVQIRVDVADSGDFDPVDRAIRAIAYATEKEIRHAV